MVHKVKVAMSVVTDALETAFGWAFCAVALYALLFVNMTGNGTLWESVRGVAMDVPVAAPKNASVQTRVVPVRPPDPDAAAVRAQNRMLLLPNEQESEFSVPVLAAGQPSRAADQITDAPADAKAGKDWRKRLNGSLRTFTVYGAGDQRSSAAASAASAQAPAASGAAAPTPATAVSAYRAGLSAASRPGVSNHVSQIGSGSGDGVRNFR